MGTPSLAYHFVREQREFTRWPWLRRPLLETRGWMNLSIPPSWILPGGDSYVPMSCAHGVPLDKRNRCRGCVAALEEAKRASSAWCQHGVPGSEPCPACSRAWLLEREMAELRREAREALEQGEAAVVLLALRWKALGYRQGLFGE